MIDLTLNVNNSMSGVQITSCRRLAEEGWNATTLELYSHSGTHMDAPRHFLPEGGTINQQDLSICVGYAQVINLTPTEPRQAIQIEDLTKRASNIQPGTRLLLRTDWHKQYGTDDYRNALPRISVELAHWLVEKQVAMVGVEPPSVADVNNMAELTEVHEILFKGNVLIIEGLANLDQLENEVVQFIALPLKIVNGDGSPVRAIAIEEVPQ
ncbi:MAG: cyclase [Alphaproteobacteria bacterium]|nr:MAG: cyclase [Alphaproteobacteria bacterium]